MAKVSFTSRRGNVFFENWYHAPLAECARYLDLEHAEFLKAREPHQLFEGGLVVVEVNAEESTSRFPPGVYLAQTPSPEKRKALFEAQYC